MTLRTTHRRQAAARAGATIVVAALAVLAAGCSSASTTAAGSVAASPVAAASPDGCPSPRVSAAEWPLAVPADLPKPPGAVISSSTVKGATTLVEFTTDTSLEGSVRFVVFSLRRAGYTLARGDAEPTEADAPFSSPKLAGAWRMSARGACATAWVLAVQPRAVTTAAPLATLIPYTPGASAAPLPGG